MTLKSIILFCFFLLSSSFQPAVSQNSTILKGNIIDYNTEQYLPGVNIEFYKNEKLLGKTTSNFENGSFNLLTRRNADKIVFSYSYYYPLIIENLNNLEMTELDIGTIELYEIPFSFTHYASKKAEREDKKESKSQLKKLKNGIINNFSGKNYKMILKKKGGKYAFYIDFKDLLNE